MSWVLKLVVDKCSSIFSTSSWASIVVDIAVTLLKPDQSQPGVLKLWDLAPRGGLRPGPGGLKPLKLNFWGGGGRAGQNFIVENRWSDGQNRMIL